MFTTLCHKHYDNKDNKLYCIENDHYVLVVVTLYIPQARLKKTDVSVTFYLIFSRRWIQQKLLYAVGAVPNSFFSLKGNALSKAIGELLALYLHRN